VIEEMERTAPVLLCKLEKIFPPGFFNAMQHMILQLPYEAQMGGQCRPIGAIQLRNVKRFFELNVKINAKLKLPLQRHSSDILEIMTSRLCVGFLQMCGGNAA